MTHRLLITALLILTIGATPLSLFAASVPSVGSLAPNFVADAFAYGAG